MKEKEEKKGNTGERRRRRRKGKERKKRKEERKKIVFGFFVFNDFSKFFSEFNFSKFEFLKKKKRKKCFFLKIFEFFFNVNLKKKFLNSFLGRQTPRGHAKIIKRPLTSGDTNTAWARQDW